MMSIHKASWAAQGCDVPNCCCGAEMRNARTQALKTGCDAEIRIYECAPCARELRLMVWLDREESGPEEERGGFPAGPGSSENADTADSDTR